MLRQPDRRFGVASNQIAIDRCSYNRIRVNILNPSKEYLVLRRKEPITRFDIHTLVNRCVKKLIVEYSSLGKKRVSPHTILHTTATHLFHSVVDINAIRTWLGHVSINTTNVYVEIDLKMKA